jgi:hypothetical protein
MTRTSLFGGAGVAVSSGRIVLLKAIRLPSGDHNGAPAPRARSVTARASPPSSASRKICGGCGLPSFSGDRTNAIALLSGDHRGLVSRVPDVKTRGAADPSAGTSQSDVS